MTYLEELLPEFRKGAKIRQTTWNNGEYIYLGENGIIYDERNKPFDFINEELFANWEFYQEHIDWDYIIKNKCLCWFWDEEDDNKVLGLLIRFPEKKDQFQYKTNIHCGAKYFKNCRPVRKNEINFYEDRKDVAED